MKKQRTVDYDVRHALRAADRRKGPRNHTPPYKYGPIYVTLGNSHRPYGRGTSDRAYLTHIIGAIYIAWRDGVIAEMCARWRCGGQSFAFRLIDEPDSIVCPACTIERTTRP